MAAALRGALTGPANTFAIDLSLNARSPCLTTGAAFARAGGAGAVQLDGRMLDKPHLTQAQRLIALAGAAG